jgi:uncharacterized membrane protein
VSDGAASPASPLPTESPRRYGRDDVEFGRSLAYVDATFAIATTLLVTTLDPGTKGWSDWAEFGRTEWAPLLAFALSFTVISAYWWGNHQLVARLDTLSARFVIGSIVLLAFIALVPFTTEGLGEYDGSAGEVSTVCYALNIAAVSVAAIALMVIAYLDGLHRVPMTAHQFRAKLVDSVDTPLVFLLSIPVAIFATPGWGRAFWALLFVTGMTTGRISQSMLRRSSSATTG